MAPAATRVLAARSHEMHLGVRRLVVQYDVAGRAVPAGLDRGAAGRVAERHGRVGVPDGPVGQQAQRAAQFLALSGQLVLRARWSLAVEPGYQQPLALEPLEALGQNVRRYARDLAEQVVEPAWPAQQGLHPQQG